jgi:hypothetical protein
VKTETLYAELGKLDPADKLLFARRMVRDAVAGLDLSSKTCECCDKTTYKNWNHFNADKELRGVVRKLGKWSVLLQEKGDE